MDITVVLTLVSASIVAGFAGWLIYLQRKAKAQETIANNKKIEGSQQLQLQAYERLVLLADRIALPKLIGRLSQAEIPARDFQFMLIQAIKEEFDYNITQQIYVSADAWTAMKQLKEQNLLTINQLAATLPPEASSGELSRLILNYLVNDPKGNLHELVSEVLSIEARKIL
jgi:type II secretory pathway pseudopilin PulG